MPHPRRIRSYRRSDLRAPHHHPDNPRTQIFDKDGTLIHFDAMWSGWMEQTVDAINDALRGRFPRGDVAVDSVKVRAAIFDAMGYGKGTTPRLLPIASCARRAITDHAAAADHHHHRRRRRRRRLNPTHGTNTRHLSYDPVAKKAISKKPLACAPMPLLRQTTKEAVAAAVSAALLDEAAIARARRRQDHCRRRRRRCRLQSHRHVHPAAQCPELEDAVIETAMVTGWDRKVDWVTLAHPRGDLRALFLWLKVSAREQATRIRGVRSRCVRARPPPWTRVAGLHMPLLSLSLLPPSPLSIPVHDPRAAPRRASPVLCAE